MKNLFSILLFAALTLSAKAQKIISDANAQKRNVSSFHAIEVGGGIDLYLSQGDESVAVSAAETKYRDRIVTEVENGVLKIKYEYNKNSNVHIDFGNHKLKAYVSFKNLDRLHASGGSDVNVDGTIKVPSLDLHVSGGSDFDGRVEASDLKVDASGGSDVKISGNATSIDIEASGGSDFKGYEMAVDMCNLDASGGSDIYITVNKELTAEASGGSDVFYKGTGVIREIKSSGSSSIKKVTK